MNLPLFLAVFCLSAALIPALLIVRNLMLYRRTPLATQALVGAREALSVLIPARDEAASIGACLDSIELDPLVDVEVLVLDDGSVDGTADIVRERARADRRIHLVTAPDLPPGWCGKQHACATLAQLARHDNLLFMDADVRLEPGALARLLSARAMSGADLLSGFPRQVTGSPLERLLIPLIHWVLLGFLPLDGMRHSGAPAFGAGCGQLMLAGRGAYRASGGHAAIRASLHDGVKLPRAFRRAGFHTHLVDATDLARCRMYRTAHETWAGLGKNATEGLAAPGAIVPMSVWLLAGAVVPPVLWLGAWLFGAPAMLTVSAGIATLAGIVSRLLLARRFQQSMLSALLHPVGVLTLLVLQWQAALARARGASSDWKGRRYAAVLSDAD